MVNKKCLVCGGFDFIADRALSGRLVCTSCGKPYGVKNINNNLYSFNLSSRKIIYVFIFVVVLVFIIF